MRVNGMCRLFTFKKEVRDYHSRKIGISTFCLCTYILSFKKMCRLPLRFIFNSKHFKVNLSSKLDNLACLSRDANAYIYVYSGS